jgi:ribosomal protein S18 acetylase RimI-like enzyme
MTATDLGYRHAESDAEILACYEPMRELRPHIGSAQEFLTRVRRQADDGYRLLACWRGGAAVAVAGYRSMETLIRGRFLYVDDLVTLEALRGSGLGARLLAAIAAEARRLGFGAVVLDTGVDNMRAQRFYAREGMQLAAYRYVLCLQ